MKLELKVNRNEEVRCTIPPKDSKLAFLHIFL